MIYNYFALLHVFSFLMITSDVHSHLALINPTWEEYKFSKFYQKQGDDPQIIIMKNCVVSCLFFFLLTSVLAWNTYPCNEDGYRSYLADYADLGKVYTDSPTDGPTDGPTEGPTEPSFEDRYSSSF